MGHRSGLLVEVLCHPAFSIRCVGEVLIPIALVIAHPVGAAEVVWVVGKGVLPHVFDAVTLVLALDVDLTGYPGLAYEDVLGGRRVSGAKLLLVEPVRVEGLSELARLFSGS